jgi:membrane protein
MVFGTIGFTIYLRFFSNYNVFYGSLAGVIIFLLWAYILMIGLLSGVVINMYFYRREKSKNKGKAFAKKENYVTNQKLRKIISSGD